MTTGEERGNLGKFRGGGGGRVLLLGYCWAGLVLMLGGATDRYGHVQYMVVGGRGTSK